MWAETELKGAPSSSEIRSTRWIVLVRVSFLQSGDILYELRKGILSSSRVKIAVAFLSKDGFEELEADLKRSLNSGNNVQLIVGISDFHITDWQALTKLLEISVAFSNLEVRYFYAEGFHPKVFFFENVEERSAIIGSSNLTNPGLTKNVEANVLLEGYESDKVFRDIEVFYRNLWEASPYLNEDVIERYKISQRQYINRVSRTRLNIPKTRLPRTSDLPSIDIVRSFNKGIAFWKVAPGKDAKEWPWWDNHISPDSKGFIAIGWNLIGDLGEMMSEPESVFKEEVRRRTIEVGYESDPNYAANQFWLFCRAIREGDIIVAYSKRHIFGIAEVIGSYYFDEREGFEDHFAHKRNVKWKALPRLVPPKHIMLVLATNDTVHLLTDMILLRYIKQLF